jgi:DNA-binding LacI/PurR family transcriptional regulator
MESSGQTDQTRRIVTRLAEYHKPIAVLRESQPSFPLREWTPGVPSALWSMACSSRDGELLGQHLLARGYRSATVLVESGDGEVGPSRAEGIRTAFGRAGLADAVRVQPLHADGPAGRTAEEAEEWAQRNSGHVDSDVLAFMRNLSGLSATALREAGVEGAYRAEYERVLRSNCSQVWVGATDPVALGALRFLAEAGVDVPGTVAVVGFDDSPSAFLRGLTSYNFATRQVVTMMVNHVLAPRHTPGPESGEIALDGFVSERASTLGRIGGR